MFRSTLHPGLQLRGKVFILLVDRETGLAGVNRRARRELLMGGGDFTADVLVGAMLNGLRRDTNGVLDGGFAGGAVCFDDGAIEPDERGPAVGVRIHAALDAAQRPA